MESVPLERIILIVLALLAVSTTVFAVTDLTPDTTPEPLYNQQNPVYATNPVLEESRTLTAIARLEAQITQLTAQINTLPTEEKLTTIKQEIADNTAQQLANNNALIVIILLAFTGFFFAVLFLCKAKRWF